VNTGMTGSEKRFWSPGIRTLNAYVPGEQPQTTGWIKLNTNECPYPPSPSVLAAVKLAAESDLRLYPDPQGTLLKESIARRSGLEPSQVFVGNGLDEVLGHAFMGLLRHDRSVLFPDVTYGFYPVYCGLYGIAGEAVPLDEKFTVDPDTYVRPNGGIVLPNPNAPTGIALPLKDVRRLLESNPDSVVLMDEAYVDFGAESAVSLINDFPNLLVVQTLSKSRALAGLRVGFAMGQRHLIQALETVKNSFNSYPLDRLALAGAQAAIDDESYFQSITQSVIQSRLWLVDALAQLGFQTLPSAANFVFTSHPVVPAAQIAGLLRARHILVRHFSQQRIDNYLRISIGTQTQCESLVQALKNTLDEGTL